MGQCFGGTQAGLSNASEAQAGPSNAAGIQAGHIPHQISLRRLKNATKKFNKNERIGEGGTGHVFRGRLEDGQLVAVKRLRPAVEWGADYECEIEMLTRLSHPNIINLIGFCVHNSERTERIERIVVYEYMPLRSLHDWLHARQAGEAALDWSTRMIIGAGVAKGLSYLHNEANPQVIFRDLKPSDVMLGRGYNPKISDFGVALHVPPQSQTSIVNVRPSDCRMTSPYWAPEAALSGTLSPKSDVYSFGVLLLEIVIRTLPRNEEVPGFVDDQVRDPANFVRLADPELSVQFEEEELIKAMTLASLCIQVDPTERPDMRDVVQGMNNLAGEPINAEWPEEFNLQHD